MVVLTIFTTALPDELAIREAGIRVAAAMRFCRLYPTDREPGRLDAADHETPASFDVTTTLAAVDALDAAGLTMVAELTGITCRIDLAVDDPAEEFELSDVRMMESGIRGPDEDDVDVDVTARISGRTIGMFFLTSVDFPAEKQRTMFEYTQ